ncbi:MAG TPA: ABC transporter permease [Gemmatimonadaceae bacterium]|nr:ABC transporter permease [Gemmatimonadaceae bacterium]
MKTPGQPDRDEELEEELASHLRMAIADRMARGESRESAERAARLDFGNVTHVKEVTRDLRRGVWLERLVQDVRYGARALRRTPAFTVVAVLTLALAIGANTAVFTVVNSVLLRPLPFRDPSRLFLVSYMPTDLPFEVPPGLPDRTWLAYRERARTFERVSAYGRSQATLSGVGDAVRLAGARVDANFFSVLGIAPVLGRSFVGEEESVGRDHVVILSNGLWHDRFAADPHVVGRVISLDGIPHVVIGVMPSGFSFPAASELWTPLAIQLDAGNSFLLSILGRLPADATPDQARNELASIVDALPRDPRDRRDRKMLAAILPLKEVLTGKVAKSLLIFSGAVAFVLLIACANVANLLLIRAATRRREMAVRVALGASRVRIARQLLTESALVGLAGGAVGVLVAQVGVRTLLAIAPQGRIPRLDEVHVDGWVLGFTIAISLITGIVFGLVPALQSARRPPAEALAHSTHVVGGVQSRLRAILVSAEVALALVLLTGAGLMIKSFVRMRHVDKGYDGARVMTMAVDLPSLRYPDVTRTRAFHTALVGRLARIPGVQSAAGASFAPMGAVGVMGNFVVDGPTPFPKGYSVDKTLVTPGYFAAMGVRLLRGRDFTANDDDHVPSVVIVSERVARRIWPNDDALGKRISMADKPRTQDWLTVVGVANDVMQDGVTEKHSTIYLPYLQTSWLFLLGHMTYVVRSDAGAASIAPAMRAALREVDPAVPAQSLQTMDDAMLQVVAEPLFQTRLLTVFSVIAILLAAIGTYGVLAYDVTERSREIALRMALGATPSDVIRMVMRRTGTLAVSGAVVGAVGSIAITRVLTKSLFEVKPTDPATIASMIVVIVLVALAAGFVPARRAARLDVLTTLPNE